MPVSPFSYRGLALPFTNSTGIQTGASLYRMGGLNVTDMPFDSDKPILGPNLTIYIPLELYLQVGNQQSTITFKGGLFGFSGFFNKLNEGNLDRAIREYEQWEVANSALEFQAKPGWGYQGGVELLVGVTRSLGLTFEINYLRGSAAIPMTGTYTGGDAGGLQTIDADFQDARIDLTGWEISIGGVFNN